MLNFLKLIESKGYLTISKELARNIGLDETLVLTELISKHNFWQNKGELTEEGYFYITIKDLKHETTLTKYRQTKAINNLKDMGLIKTKTQGLPARRYFKIIELEIKKLFFDIDTEQAKKSDNPRNGQEVKNSKTREVKIRQQEVKNLPQLRSYNKNLKIEEEEAPKKSDNSVPEPPDKISQKYQQVFNRQLTAEMYLKLLQLFSDNKIIYKALQVAEQKGDKPAYLIKLLKDWKEKGLTSLLAIEKYITDRQQKKIRNGKNSIQGPDQEALRKYAEVEEMEKMGWN